MKNKLLFFLCIFSIAIIFTYPVFVNSHSLDSYCTMFNGYSQTAFWFLQNGRIFSALIFYLFSLINFPFDSLSFVSSFLSALVLALCVCRLYYILDNNLKLKRVLEKGILLVSIFLMFFNFLAIELIAIDESFVIFFGIYFVILSAQKLIDGGGKNCLLSLTYMILALSCYQGIACFLFPILLLILITSGKYSIKDLFKYLFYALIIYGISFLFEFILIKIVGLIDGSTIGKLGNMNLIDNFIIIIKDLLPQALKTFFGFINAKYYYAFCIVLLLSTIYLIYKDNRKKNYIILLILIVSCIISPFIPNLFMNSDSNYTAARMTMTLAIFPSLFVIYYLIFPSQNKFLTYFICFVICLFALFTFYLYHQSSKINLKRYKEDMIYINNVKSYINYYNDKHKEKIKRVYYARDINSSYYYSFGHPNGINVRLSAIDWAIECAYPVYTEKKYEFKPMKKSDYNKYFKGKDYNYFNVKKQIRVEGENMYLLIY